MERLVISNEPPSTAEAVTILDALRAKEREIIHIQAEIDRLLLLRDQASDACAQYRAVLSPLRQFPLEILAEIFVHSLPDNADPWEWRQLNKLKAPWVFCEVSRTWRAAALSQPQLWTNIKGIATSQFIDRMNVLFTRTGSLPLSVSLSFPWNSEQETVNRVVDAILANDKRYESMELWVTGRQASILNALKSASFDLLTTLCLLSDPVLLGEDYARIAASDFLQIVQRCPALQCCDVRLDVQSDAITPHTIVLPHLTSLSTRCNSLSDCELGPLLDALILPLLNHLTLEYSPFNRWETGNMPVASLVSLWSRSGCTLTSLAVKEFDLWREREAIVELFKHRAVKHSLQVLDLQSRHGTPSSILKALTPSLPSNDVMLPGLKRLAVVVVDSYQAATIRGLVTRRAKFRLSILTFSFENVSQSERNFLLEIRKMLEEGFDIELIDEAGWKDSVDSDSESDPDSIRAFVVR